jgi:phosphoserine phosphatase
VRTATVAELLATLEDHVAREPGGAIALDGDGTMWSGDVGDDLFHALLDLDDGAISPLAREAMAREAAAENVDTSGGGVAVARRIHAAYLAGSFPEERVCEIMTWAFAGWAEEELEAFAGKVLASAKLEARLHAEVTPVLAWARARRVAIYLVSASPRAIVEQAARVVGIERANVAAATPELDAGGRLLASVVRPIPYGPGKVMHLRAKLGARPLYAAFGDNIFDIPMLREARTPIAIRPKVRLVDRAAEVPELAVLERV